MSEEEVTEAGGVGEEVGVALVVFDESDDAKIWM